MILSVIAFYISHRALADLGYNQLKSIQQIKKKTVEEFFNKMKLDAKSVIDRQEVVQLTRELLTYEENLELDASSKLNLSAELSSIYDRYDRYFNYYTDENGYGYYDVFIICAKHGHVLYSKEKAADLGENLSEGMLKESGLAMAWKKAITKNKISFTDMQPYAPSNNKPSMFIAVPLHIDEELAAVVALQLPNWQIREMMSFRDGMGRTGESYLIGKDFLLRSDTFRDMENHSLAASFKNPSKGKIETKAAREAMSGKIGVDQIINYRGDEVLSSWGYIDLDEDVRWGIIVEIDASEIDTPVSDLRSILALIALCMIIIMYIIFIFITKSIITKPLKKFSDIFIKGASGEFKERYEMDREACEYIKGEVKVDIPGLCEGYQCWFEQGSKAPLFDKEITCPVLLEGKVKSCDRCVIFNIIAGSEVDELGSTYNKFIDSVSQAIQVVKKTSNELATSAEGMHKTSESFSDNAQSQAATAEQVSAAIEEISSGMDIIAENTNTQYDKLELLIYKMSELSMVISDINNQVNEISSLTHSISDKAESGESSLKKMNNTMSNIINSSKEVGNIVSIINDISEKINLLALNAAIESARAGDAGRGFAVVSDEISKLADQTAMSIKNIDKLLAINNRDIEIGMKNVVGTIENISEIIDGVTSIKDMINKMSESMNKQISVNQTVNSDADAVKKLSNQIKNSTEEQRIAASEIVTSISTINELTQSNAFGSKKLSENSEIIAKTSISLKDLTDFFKI